MENGKSEKLRALKEEVRALEEEVRALEEMTKSGIPPGQLAADALGSYIQRIKDEIDLCRRLASRHKEKPGGPLTETAKVKNVKVKKVPPNVLGEKEGQILVSRCKEMIRAYLPETFKIGRQGFFRLRSPERIFGIDKKKLAEANITEVDFMAFSIAMYKALSNQSYISGNQDTHSGTSRIKADRATKLQKAEAEQKAEQETDPKKREALEKAAITAYTGEVVVSLPELCKDGYGDTKATTLHKRAMDNVINFLSETPITVHYASGDIQGTYICRIMSWYTEKANGTTFYELHLNPAYSENVARNFGELPQNAMKRLAACTKKLTAPNMNLLLRLSLQGKKKPFTRTLEELIEELGVDVNTYKEQPARVEGQIIKSCDTMVKVGAAESYEPNYTTSARGREQLRKVTFYPVKDRDDDTSKG